MKSIAVLLLVAFLSAARGAPLEKADSYVEGTILTVLPYGLVVDAQILDNGAKTATRQRAFLYNAPKGRPFAAGESILAQTLHTGTWHEPNGTETLPALKVLRITRKK
jgi:hypothetical protein